MLDRRARVWEKRHNCLVYINMKIPYSLLKLYFFLACFSINDGQILYK